MTAAAAYSENELLEKIAGGDEGAFAGLFERYHHMLGAHIFALTRSHAQTEELVQDCFLKIWISRESLCEIKNFRAWLFAISRNAAISHMRKNITEQNRFDQYRHYQGSLLDDETARQKEEALSLIDEAIENLSPRQKEILLLSRQQGMSYEEIGKKLGLSKLTVREHIKQAVLSIKRFVKENGSGLSSVVLIIFLKK